MTLGSDFEEILNFWTKTIAVAAAVPLIRENRAMSKRKPILCLDFDGVCHSYSSGWQGATNIPDPPVEGLFSFIARASSHFDVQIFSSRSRFDGGIEAMKNWFCERYIELARENEPDALIVADYATKFMDLLTFPDHKPPAQISIDDRAVTFTGEWPSLDFLKAFKPWTKGQDNLEGYEALKEANNAS